MSLEQALYCPLLVPFLGSRFLQFPLQHLEEQTAELLCILLDRSLPPAPPERLHQHLGRNGLVRLTQIKEQILKSSRKLSLILNLSLIHQIPRHKNSCTWKPKYDKESANKSSYSKYYPDWPAHYINSKNTPKLLNSNKWRYLNLLI